MMITLDKLLRELNPESLNEIVAGCGGKAKNRSNKSGSHSNKSGSHSNKSGSHKGGKGKKGKKCPSSFVPIALLPE